MIETLWKQAVSVWKFRGGFTKSYELNCIYAQLSAGNILVGLPPIQLSMALSLKGAYTESEEEVVHTPQPQGLTLAQNFIFLAFH